jgi:hypothetical protein
VRTGPHLPLWTGLVGSVGRPSARRSLTQELVLGWQWPWTALAKRPTVGMVVLTGPGSGRRQGPPKWLRATRKHSSMLHHLSEHWQSGRLQSSSSCQGLYLLFASVLCSSLSSPPLSLTQTLIYTHLPSLNCLTQLSHPSRLLVCPYLPSLPIFCKPLNRQPHHHGTFCCRALHDPCR